MARKDEITKLESRLDIAVDKIEKIQIDVAQHKANDEAMARQLDDVKDALAGTNKHLESFNEKMGQYNHQLGLHIAGVQELRRIADAAELRQQKFEQESDARLKRLERPFVWVDVSVKILKFVGILIPALAAVYGATKFLTEVLQLF